MKKGFSRVVARFVCWSFLCLSITAFSATAPEHRAEVTRGVAVSYFGNWQPAQGIGPGALELIAREPAPKAPGQALQSRILVTTEPRTDFEDALKRLRDIAAEVPGARPLFLTIGGWPALQRRYRVPLERVGEEDVAPGQRPLSERVTTAVAVGDTLVRQEAAFAPGTSEKLIVQAEQIGRALQVRAPSAEDKARGDAFLREMKSGASPPTQAPSNAPSTPGATPAHNQPAMSGPRTTSRQRGGA